LQQVKNKPHQGQRKYAFIFEHSAVANTNVLQLNFEKNSYHNELKPTPQWRIHQEVDYECE
jgi:hypothetical protein